jgi:hypothetical protein
MVESHFPQQICQHGPYFHIVALSRSLAKSVGGFWATSWLLQRFLTGFGRIVLGMREELALTLVAPEHQRPPHGGSLVITTSVSTNSQFFRLKY